MHRSEAVRPFRIEHINQSQINKSFSRRLANAISNSKLVKKISPKGVNIIAALGYILPFAYLALTLPNMFVTEGTATTLGVASSWIANITYIPLGFLAGLVASANIFKSCEELMNEAEHRDQAKQYLPSFRRFDFLEIIQWFFVAGILLSLAGMTFSDVNDDSNLLKLSQTLGTFTIMLSSAIRTIENAWLSYRQSQLKKIVDKEKLAEKSRLVSENKQYQDELDAVRDELNIQAKELNYANQLITTLENFIGNDLNQYGKRVVMADAFHLWAKKGLKLIQLQAIQQVEACENIESNEINHLVEQNQLTVMQALNLSRAKRKFLEFIFRKNWKDKINPTAILELVDANIHKENLEHISISNAIDASLLDPLIAVELQAHHLQELEEQKIGYLLLNEAAITQEDFFKRTSEQLQQLNQLKPDRAVDVIKTIPIDEFLKLIPLSIKIEAINSENMLHFMAEKQLKSQLANINSADDLANFINLHQPQSDPSQKLKL